MDLESAKSFTMPFGKHKGKKLTEIPESYVKWMLENISDGSVLKALKVLEEDKAHRSDPPQKPMSQEWRDTIDRTF